MRKVDRLRRRDQSLDALTSHAKLPGLALIVVAALVAGCGAGAPASVQSTALGVHAGGGSVKNVDLANLESATDAVVLATVTRIGKTTVNTLDGQPVFRDRETLDNAVPLTNVDLQVDRSIGVRAKGRIASDSVVGGALVHLTIIHGAVSYTTTAEERRRLGIEDIDDSVPGKRTVRQGDLTLTLTMDNEVDLALNHQYVLYLRTEDLHFADSADQVRRIIGLSHIQLSILPVTKDGKLSPKVLPLDGGLSTLAEVETSARRIAASTEATSTLR